MFVINHCMLVLVFELAVMPVGAYTYVLHESERLFTVAVAD